MNAPLTLGADVIGASFANDPELHLPEYPRFPSEILVLPYQQSGLLFEGARGTQILNGRAARGFIPALIQRLDGTRHFSDLLHAFAPVPPQSVHDALALLYSRGLLEDGVAEIDDPALADCAAFCGRYIDVTRVNRNRGEALSRLASTRLAWAASDAAARSLSHALQGQGIGSLRHLQDPDQLTDLPDLLILVSEGDDALTQEWLALAWQRRFPVLHARITRDVVEIGPLFMPGKSACYSCLREIRSPRLSSAAAPDLGFWCGVIALHAFHIVSRVGNPNLYNLCHVHTRDAQGAIYEEVKIARLPGCGTCGLAGCTPRLHERNGLVWLLHNAANGMPPQQLLSPRDYQMHYAAANIQTTKEVPDPYFGAERWALPEGAGFALAPRWSAAASPAVGELSIDNLAGLLRYAVGYTPGQPRRRLAPSAGGLGSAEAFLIVRDIPGLAKGVYHYYAHDHYLERLKPTSDRVLAGALGLTEAELPSLLWIGIANLTKLRQKYNDFSFRFASLDAGIVRCFLVDLCQSLGLPIADFPHARDAVLAEAVGLPTIGTRNIVTHVMGIGRGVRYDTAHQINAHHYVDLLASLAGKLDAPAPPMQAMRKAKLRAWPMPPTPSLGELLRRRQSVRVFRQEPIPFAVIDDIAGLAHAINEELAAIGGLTSRMRLWMAARLPADADAGIYRWDSCARALLRVRRGLTHEDLGKTMLQQALAQAPVVLFITGDFGEAVRQAGARGYRELMIRAGAIAARALVAAELHGLAGCPWGGLSEDGWGELLQVDRYTNCPLFGVSLGYPAVDR
jgi:SagB-type dehydrogenase family enzyme